MADIPDTDSTRTRSIDGEAQRLSATPEKSLAQTGRTVAPTDSLAPAKQIARQVMEILRREQSAPEPSAEPAQSEIIKPKSQIEDPLPARMLNEFVYCPRLFYYEFVEGVFVESADTQRGSNLHQRVDAGSGALPAAKTKTEVKEAEVSAPKEEKDEPEVIHSRSVAMGSERLGVTAKIDLVEVRASGTEPGETGDLLALEVCPVDYKA